MYRMWMVLGVAFVAAGCDEPGSTCERAQARLDECAEEARAEYAERAYLELPIVLDSCESVPNQCLASCVVDSKCDAINATIFGHHTDPNAPPQPPGAGQFSLCVDYCVTLARPPH